MNGEQTLYNLIISSSDITDLLTDISGYPCVAVGIVEPDAWGLSDSTISFYSTGRNNSDTALLSGMTVNCRAPSEGEVKAIAGAFNDVVNRYRIPDNQGQFYTQTLPVIPPADENDVYNLPITVTLKAVKELA